MKLVALPKKTVKKGPTVGDIVNNGPHYFMRIDPKHGVKILPNYDKKCIFWVNLKDGKITTSSRAIETDIIVKPINNGQIFERK